MSEIWKDIRGYEGLYQVSNLGNIKALNWHRMRIEQNLRPKLTKDGYYETTLYREGKPKFVRTHRIVATAFCDGWKDGLEVNHIDGNKLNNRADNLEWVTSSENQKHAYRLGLQTICGGALMNRKKIRCIDLEIETDSMAKMQRALCERGYTKSKQLNRLSTIMNCGTNKYLGLRFEFVDEGGCFSNEI